MKLKHSIALLLLLVYGCGGGASQPTGGPNPSPTAIGAWRGTFRLMQASTAVRTGSAEVTVTATNTADGFFLVDQGGERYDVAVRQFFPVSFGAYFEVTRVSTGQRFLGEPGRANLNLQSANVLVVYLNQGVGPVIPGLSAGTVRLDLIRVP